MSDTIVIPEPVSPETLAELICGRECVISHGEAEHPATGYKMPVIILDFEEWGKNEQPTRNK